MAVVPRIEGFGVMPNERAAFQGLSYVDPGIQQKPLDFGSVADRLDKVQTEFDEARVETQLNSLRKSALDLERGENGFKNLLGENAMSADDAKRGMVERYDILLRKAGDDLTKDLTPHQQQLFARKAESIYLAQQASAQQHWLEQSNAFLNDSYEGAVKNSVEIGAQSFDKLEALDENYNVIAQNAMRLRKHNGWTQEQEELYVRQNASAMYKGAIFNALEASRKDPAKAEYALALLEESASSMTSEDVIQCRKLIDGQLDVIRADTLESDVAKNGIRDEGVATTAALVAAVGSGDQKRLRSASQSVFLTKGVGVLSAGGHQLDGNTGQVAVDKIGGESAKDQWGYGAARLPVLKAKKAAERLGEPFDEQRFMTDQGYNQRLGAEHFSEMSIAFCGDLDMAMAAYRTSEETVREAVDKAKKEGNPGEWLAHLDPEVQKTVLGFRKAIQDSQRFDVRDSKGQKVNALTPDYVNGKSVMVTKTAEEVRKEILDKDARARVDPTWREARVQGTLRRIEEQKKDYKIKQIERLAEVKNILYSSNGNLSAVPSSLLASFDLDQQDALHKLAKKIADKDESTNMPLFNKFMANDALLLAMSDAEINAYQGEISGKNWAALRKRYDELKQAQVMSNDQRSYERAQGMTGNAVGNYAKLSSEEVERELFNFLPEDTIDEMKKNADFKNMVVSGAVRHLVQAGQAMGVNFHGKPEDMKQELTKYFANEVVVSGFFFDKNKPLALLQISDFPDHSKEDATEVIKRLGTAMLRWRNPTLDREPNEQECNEALHMALTLRNPPFAINPKELGLSAPLTEHVIQGYKKKHGGKDPTASDVFRMYLIARLEGVKLTPEAVPDASGLIGSGYEIGSIYGDYWDDEE